MIKQFLKYGMASLAAFLLRVLIPLRYRLVFKGLDQLNSEHFKKSGGILFLPNHPAELDPIIMEAFLWNRFRPRPLIVEHFYMLKGFRFFMDLVGSMPLPTMDVKANRWRGKKLEKQFNAVATALRSKSNFLIYPSGRLKISGMELIGGASFVHRLVQECPETNIVLVRTTGMWGSKFSKAQTGASPDFGKVLWECFKIILKNGIFFAPKRDVLIELSLPPVDFPLNGTRLEFNKALENWYNRYPEPGPEPMKLVSYAFWKEDLPKIAVSTGRPRQLQALLVSPKVKQEVCTFLGTLCGKAADQIESSMHLSHDLGLDSLDLVQVYLFLDERFHVTDLLPGDLQTVEDVLQFAVGYQRERQEEKPDTPMMAFKGWPKETSLTPEIPPGESIHEVFLRSCDRNGSRTACLDMLSGHLSYARLKLGALVMADKIRKMPGDKIGVMLPSSSGAYLVILSVLLAGKVPVMLNWTAGVKSLDHCADLTGLKVVLTSEKFLDRLENGELGKIEELFCFLEAVKESVSLKDKLSAYLMSLRKAPSLLRKLKLSHLRREDPAVILFTSGTESLPKGVPLSHFNILSNIRSVVKDVELFPEDILYAVLPPFHSFGFTFSGLLPLLTGLRVCFAPDPTDSHGLARNIADWKPTLFWCAPSFISALFRVAAPEQLQSLRAIVSGAEKAPKALFDYCKTHLPHTQLLEGYGITECSPVVTCNFPGEISRGVGRPVFGVDVMILDNATGRPLPVGQEGEVCIHGPNVFSGYLGNPRNPFIVVDGKQWYLSGDRGLLDADRHLILSGRLKRFVKIGGEMVSLGGLEEELLELAKSRKWLTGTEEGPSVAVSVREKESDKPIIVLYTTFPITRDEVNTALKESGYARIVKVGEVRIVDEIPLTGTGKTHYRLLDEMQE